MAKTNPAGQGVSTGTWAAVRVGSLLLILPLAAAFCLMATEEWSFFDSLYMAVITLSTVGFQEVHPLSDQGRFVIIVCLVLGLGVFMFSVINIGEAVLNIQLRNILGSRKMEATIKALKGHTIICGYGRVGRVLCEHLDQRTVMYVVIDRDEEAIAHAQERGLLALAGDATDDELLEKAGLNKAAALAAVLPSDADNLYVVLSAKLVNPKLRITARASGRGGGAKLTRAGADHVVSPHESGAIKMAQLLTYPELEDFMSILTSQGKELDLAEIIVVQDASYCGRRLKETDLRERGVLVVGHQKPGGDIEIPPDPDGLIEKGDVLIAFGNAGCISELIQGV